MKNTLICVLVVVVLLVAGFFGLNSYIYNEKQSDGLSENYKEATFVIGSKPITLVDGHAFVKTQLSLENVSTIQYFGNEVAQDIDNDGVEDMVFLITEGVGEGNNYLYLVGALKREGGYLGTKAVLLGNNLAPQTTEKADNGMVVVNYVASYPDSPSVSRSVWLKLDPQNLEFGEVVQNFEGEADY